MIFIPNSNYLAGAALERAFMKWAERTYACSAIRSSGSHGKADVVLVPLNDIRGAVLNFPVLVQVKRSNEKGKEYEEFKQWPVDGFLKWWVSKEKGVGMDKMKIEVL